MHQMPERAALPHIGEHGNTVPVRILTDDGTLARVLVEGAGIHLRQGSVHTVPSSSVERHR